MLEKLGQMFSALFNAIKKLPVGKMLKPLWKGAAKSLLNSQFSTLRDKIKAAIDDDRDASIVRINKLCDKAQFEIIAGLSVMPLLPASMRASIQEKVQAEGDKIQANIAAMVKQRGPVAVDAAFSGIRLRLDEMIESL